MKRDRYSGARAPRLRKASKALLTAIWKDLSLLQASFTILHPRAGQTSAQLRHAPTWCIRPRNARHVQRYCLARIFCTMSCDAHGTFDLSSRQACLKLVQHAAWQQPFMLLHLLLLSSC